MTTKTAHRVDTTGRRRPRQRIRMDWALGTGIALGLVSIAYLIAQSTGAALLVAGPGGTAQEVAFGQVVGMTLVGALVGAVLAYTARRWAPRPRTLFLTITLLALASYGAVPFMAAETTTTALWLNAFHVAVAAPVLWAISRHLPASRS